MGTAGFLRGPDEVVVDVGMRVIDAGPTQQRWPPASGRYQLWVSPNQCSFF